jgi:WD40 repeat protein
VDPPWVAGLTFTPDGKRLVRASHKEGVIRVFDTATWDQVLALRGHIHPLESVGFAPGGETLVSTDHNGIVREGRTK